MIKTIKSRIFVGFIVTIFMYMTLVSFGAENNNIEYDVYKKVDISEFVRDEERNGQNALVEHKEDGIIFSDQPCKVTIKANVKFEKGPGFSDAESNDAFSVVIDFGVLSANIYYADYGKDFFGSFHEVERAYEFYNGRAGNGYIGMDVFGVSGLTGNATGYIEKYVSHNDTEYVGEFLTQDKSKTKLKVIIKDIYYKVSKPTGIVSEWDLNKDFSCANFYGTQCFDMRELDEGYTYILKPKFTINIDSEYDQRQAKYLDFYYTSTVGTPDLCTSIISERENDFEPRYKKLGVGIHNSKWKMADNGAIVEVSLSWDKNSKTITATDKNGKLAGTIKIDYIKEYKYKNCIENDTPGYKKYVMATNKNNIERDKKEDIQQKNNAMMKMSSRETDRRNKDYYDRRIESCGIEDKVMKIGDNQVLYTFIKCKCNVIPNFNDIIENITGNCIEKFFTEYFNCTPKKEIKITGKMETSAQNNLCDTLYIIYKYHPNNSEYVELTIYVDLINLKYCYSGYWKTGSVNQKQAKGKVNNSGQGSINRDYIITPQHSYYKHVTVWNDVGGGPLFTNWNYEPIKNIVPIENANVGDYIHFGKNLTDFIHYDIEEIDSWDNYKSDIEWRVLDKKDDKILVISRHVIWCILFDNKEKCTWEDSNMRLRLNSVFIEQTFNDDEKEKIIDDDEKIFLLSEEEVKKYFSDDNDRRCKATYNMRQNGCWYSLESDVCGNCWYWLRTLRQGFIDENEIKAPDGFMYVNEYGEIITTGERANLNTSNIGVRPAMWIKIN